MPDASEGFQFQHIHVILCNTKVCGQFYSVLSHGFKDLFAVIY